MIPWKRVRSPKYIKNSHDSTLRRQTIQLKVGKGPKETLLQTGHTEGPESYERMLSITSSQEMQIKTTVKYHSHQSEHKQINKQQVLMRLWRKGNPSTLLMGMQPGAAVVENSMEFPQNTKNATAFDLAFPLLGLYPKNPESPIQKNLCTPMFIAAQFTVAKCWKQPKCP